MDLGVTIQNSIHCLHVNLTEWKNVSVCLHKINCYYLVSSQINFFLWTVQTIKIFWLPGVRTKSSFSIYPWLSGEFLEPNAKFCIERWITDKWWMWTSLPWEVSFCHSSSQQAPLRWKHRKIDAWAKPGSSHLILFERALNLPVSLIFWEEFFPLE